MSDEDTRVIVVEHPDDSSRVAILIPTGEIPLEDVLQKDVNTEKFHMVVEYETLPIADEDFYEAWHFHEGEVKVNLERAKDIHRNRLRAQRAPLLQQLDVDFMRADEMGDMIKKAEVVASKQKLRNLPTHPSIAGASSTSELRALTLEVLLA